MGARNPRNNNKNKNQNNGPKPQCQSPGSSQLRILLGSLQAAINAGEEQNKNLETNWDNAVQDGKAIDADQIVGAYAAAVTNFNNAYNAAVTRCAAAAVSDCYNADGAKDIDNCEKAAQNIDKEATGPYDALKKFANMINSANFPKDLSSEIANARYHHGQWSKTLNDPGSCQCGSTGNSCPSPGNILNEIRDIQDGKRAVESKVSGLESDVKQAKLNATTVESSTTALDEQTALLGAITCLNDQPCYDDTVPQSAKTLKTLIKEIF